MIHVPPVLMYHQVDERPQTTQLARSLTVTPSQFAGELSYLQAHHRRAVGVNQYIDAVRSHTSTDDMVIITFDDGYADQYTRAFPILQKFHAGATFFITTGNVGKMNHVTWSDIGIMQRHGMTFGGHSVEHIDLAELSKSGQEQQIGDSLDALAAHLGARPTTYAYPGGTFNRLSETVLERDGVELAFTTDPSHELGAMRRFEIPRVRVEGGMSIDAFAAAIATPPALRFSLDVLPMPQIQPLRPQATSRPSLPRHLVLRRS